MQCEVRVSQCRGQALSQLSELRCLEAISCDFWWLKPKPNPTSTGMHVHPTPLKTLIQVTFSREMFFGKPATHVTRLRKEVVSLAGARLYRALAVTEGRLNFTQSTSPMVVTTACLCHSTNMQTLSPLPDSTRPRKAEILRLVFVSFPVPVWHGQSVWKEVKKITESSLQRSYGNPSRSLVITRVTLAACASWAGVPTLSRPRGLLF